MSGLCRVLAIPDILETIATKGFQGNGVGCVGYFLNYEKQGNKDSSNGGKADALPEQKCCRICRKPDTPDTDLRDGLVARLCRVSGLVEGDIDADTLTPTLLVILNLDDHPHLKLATTTAGHCLVEGSESSSSAATCRLAHRERNGPEPRPLMLHRRTATRI